MFFFCHLFQSKPHAIFTLNWAFYNFFPGLKQERLTAITQREIVLGQNTTLRKTATLRPNKSRIISAHVYSALRKPPPPVTPANPLWHEGVNIFESRDKTTQLQFELSTWFDKAASSDKNWCNSHVFRSTRLFSVLSTYFVISPRLRNPLRY